METAIGVFPARERAEEGHAVVADITARIAQPDGTALLRDAIRDFVEHGSELAGLNSVEGILCCTPRSAKAKKNPIPKNEMRGALHLGKMQAKKNPHPWKRSVRHPREEKAPPL